QGRREVRKEIRRHHATQHPLSMAPILKPNCNARTGLLIALTGLMTRKEILWISTASMLLVGLFAYAYRDRLRPGEIQIYHRLSAGRPIRTQRSTNQVSAVGSVAFGLDQKYRLTDLKVISLAQLATNQHPQPLWHLVSSSNSAPVNGFVY